MYMDELTENMLLPAAGSNLVAQYLETLPSGLIKCEVVTADQSGRFRQGEVVSFSPVYFGIRQRDKFENVRNFGSFPDIRTFDRQPLLPRLTDNPGLRATLVFKGLDDDESLYLLVDRSGSDISLVVIDPETDTRYEMLPDQDQQRELARVIG